MSRTATRPHALPAFCPWCDTRTVHAHRGVLTRQTRAVCESCGASGPAVMPVRGEPAEQTETRALRLWLAVTRYAAASLPRTPRLEPAWEPEREERAA